MWNSLSSWEWFYKSDPEGTQHFNMGAIASVPKENCVVCSGVGYCYPLYFICIYLFESSTTCLLMYPLWALQAMLWALQAMNVWENLKNLSLNYCPVITIPYICLYFFFFTPSNFMSSLLYYFFDHVLYFLKFNIL